MKSLAFATSLCLAATLGAQVTTGSILIGEKGSRGCGAAPLLSNSDRASARYDFSYDSSKSELTLVVTNTSPVQVHPNPVLTDIWFNLPHRAVSSMQLVSQKMAHGTRWPKFAPTFDPDLSSTDKPNATQCMGAFSVHLKSTLGGLKGAIGNHDATKFADAPTVLGPVTFQFKLAGTGLESLTAQNIVDSWAWGISKDMVTAAASFGGSGKDCDGAGMLSGWNPGCRAASWVNSTPRIGTTIQICQSMKRDCHGCLAASLSQGPTRVGNAIAPIGLPVSFFLAFGQDNPGNTRCHSIAIPNNPQLRGLKMYMSIVTVNSVGWLEFSPRMTVQVTSQQ